MKWTDEDGKEKIFCGWISELERGSVFQYSEIRVFGGESIAFAHICTLFCPKDILLIK